MKHLLLIVSIFVSTLTFGQQEPEVIAKFKDTERIGNLITRWYYDIVGTSLVWKKTLTLYSDSTYRYVYRGGECGTFDEDRRGVWNMRNDTLLLDTGSDLLTWSYIIANDRLYDLQTDISESPDKWIMK